MAEEREQQLATARMRLDSALQELQQAAKQADAAYEAALAQWHGEKVRLEAAWHSEAEARRHMKQAQQQAAREGEREVMDAAACRCQGVKA